MDVSNGRGSDCISVLNNLAVEGMEVSNCDRFLLCLENE